LKIIMADSRIVSWHAEKIFTLAAKGNVAAMKKAAFMGEADVKKHFTLVGSGRTYGKHIASKPSEPPAVDEGILRASIMSDVKVKGSEVTGKIGPDIEHIKAKTEAGTDVEYGLYLELGTSKMQPRTFLRPALRRQQNNIKRLFKGANK